VIVYRQRESGFSMTACRRLLRGTTAALMLLGAAACGPVIEPIVDYQGYQPRGEDLQKVQIGMSKQEVQALLGSPSTTATIEQLGEGYYYISSKVETVAFFEPRVVERQIFAV